MFFECLRASTKNDNGKTNQTDKVKNENQIQNFHKAKPIIEKFAFAIHLIHMQNE
jgi:hypothetical protein